MRSMNGHGPSPTSADAQVRARLCPSVSCACFVLAAGYLIPVSFFNCLSASRQFRSSSPCGRPRCSPDPSCTFGNLIVCEGESRGCGAPPGLHRFGGLARGFLTRPHSFRGLIMLATRTRCLTSFFSRHTFCSVAKNSLEYPCNG